MGLGFKCLTFKFAHMHLRLLWSRLKVPLQISQRSFSGGQIWWWCRFQAGLSVFPEDWNLSDCRRQVLKSYRGMKKKKSSLVWFYLIFALYFTFRFVFLFLSDSHICLEILLWDEHPAANVDIYKALAKMPCVPQGISTGTSALPSSVKVLASRTRRKVLFACIWDPKWLTL